MEKSNRKLATAVQNACQIDYSALAGSLKIFDASFTEMVNQSRQAIVDAVMAFSNAQSVQMEEITECLIDACNGLVESMQFSIPTLNLSGSFVVDGAIKSEKENCAVCTEEPAALPPTVPINEKVVESLQKITPIVPEENREKFDQIVTPSKKNKVLTAENVKWLLGIIIPMFFTLFIRTLPDENSEESIYLQKESNAIEQARNELLEEQVDLMQEYLEYLEQSGIDLQPQVAPLTEQPDVLGDSSEDFVNAVDAENQDEDTSAEDHDPEPQQE